MPRIFNLGREKAQRFGIIEIKIKKRSNLLLLSLKSISAHFHLDIYAHLFTTRHLKLYLVAPR